MQVAQAALAAEPHAGILKAFGGIDPDDRVGLFGKRQRHPASPAAGVEHATTDRHARAFEKRDHFRAAVVLEERVIVFGTETQIRVRLDGAFVNLSHARSVPFHSVPRRICR
jgi:hypothetical protein